MLTMKEPRLSKRAPNNQPRSTCLSLVSVTDWRCRAGRKMVNRIWLGPPQKMDRNVGSSFWPLNFKILQKRLNLFLGFFHGQGCCFCTFNVFSWGQEWDNEALQKSSAVRRPSTLKRNPCVRTGALEVIISQHLPVFQICFQNARHAFCTLTLRSN